MRGEWRGGRGDAARGTGRRGNRRSGGKGRGPARTARAAGGPDVGLPGGWQEREGPVHPREGDRLWASAAGGGVDGGTRQSNRLHPIDCLGYASAAVGVR